MPIVEEMQLLVFLRELRIGESRLMSNIGCAPNTAAVEALTNLPIPHIAQLSQVIVFRKLLEGGWEMRLYSLDCLR